MSVIAFPRVRTENRGCVHVMQHAGGGFEVGHESASGNSWGSFSGPYARGQDAIAAAYALNRDTYGGVCEVYICPAALADIPPSPAPAFERGDF